MLEAGMNVARVNFSHGDHAQHIETVRRLREVASAEGYVLALLGDLQGPKLRLGNIRPGGISLSLGDEVVLTPRPGQPAMIHLPHPDLIAAVQPGSRLVIGDGEVEFTVAEKRDDTLRCIVTVAGLLEARKGVNAPGTDLPISCLSDKDRRDLDLICELEFDYVALSFVRTAEDVLELRALMENKPRQIPIISKIEKSEAIDNLLAIRDVTDGMMVARGDLGIEMLAQEVPLLQKRIIRVCNEVGKPVITATQMLQSMVEHPRPTRAEASDVANAILDGTDAVMLSGETATGNFPVDSVMMMRQIAENTEREYPFDRWRAWDAANDHEGVTVTEAISAASCAIAEEIQASAIVSATMSGYTAQQVARFRPRTRVRAVSPSGFTQRKLALVWGVQCFVVPDFDTTDTMLRHTLEAARKSGLPDESQIVVTAGVPFGAEGHTNFIQVYTI